MGWGGNSTRPKVDYETMAPDSCARGQKYRRFEGPRYRGSQIGVRASSTRRPPHEWWGLQSQVRRGLPVRVRQASDALYHWECDAPRGQGWPPSTISCLPAFSGSKLSLPRGLRRDAAGCRRTHHRLGSITTAKTSLPRPGLLWTQGRRWPWSYGKDAETAI